MSSTHREYVGDGYSVIIQHCEHDGCDVYLGVAYPSDFCDEHRPPTPTRPAVAPTPAQARP